MLLWWIRWPLIIGGIFWLKYINQPAKAPMYNPCKDNKGRVHVW